MWELQQLIWSQLVIILFQNSHMIKYHSKCEMFIKQYKKIFIIQIYNPISVHTVPAIPPKLCHMSFYSFNKRRCKVMWPSYHKHLPAVNLITVPVKYISTDQVTAREDFNNLLPYFQPATISISKWFRPLPGITYDFHSRKTNFYSNQTHKLNTWVSLLKIMNPK